METISKTIPPEEDGATVRHILKAHLHFSSHAVSRLTRQSAVFLSMAVMPGRWIFSTPGIF